MAWKRASKKKRADWRGRARRWLVWLRWAGLTAVAVSAGEVLLCRFWDPPFTPLMGVRKLEAYWAGKTPPPVKYEWRDLDQVPSEFLRFVWISEDGRFFRHSGFDWVEMKHTLEEAWESGRAPRGASTITMQCARSLFLWQGRSWARKVLEAYYTIWMELLLPKKRILELYVNVIEMGDGVYGIEAGAQHHFGKPARELSPDKLAALAAILPSPRRWDPANPTERVEERRKRIMERTARSGARLPWER